MNLFKKVKLKKLYITLTKEEKSSIINVLLIYEKEEAISELT